MLPDLILPALRALGVFFFVLAAGCAEETSPRTTTRAVPVPGEPAAASMKQYSVAIVPPTLELLEEVTVTQVRRPR